MKAFRILLLAFAFAPAWVSAQQEYMVTHYMFNGLGINPAYAGVHGAVSTSFLARQQWVGFEGAPSTQLASIHSPIKNHPISLGAVLFHDQLGISDETGAYLSYAYRIKVSSQFRLSMGLQANAHNYAVKYGRANNSAVDDYEGHTSLNQFSWNFGTGFLLHSERAYLGISVPQIFSQKLMIDDPDGKFTEIERHYYLSAGYAFDMGPDLILKPNILVKAVEGAPVQVDINANLLIKSVVWVGASYRSFDSIDGILGLQISPKCMISYAADLTLTEINATSHEIMLNFIFELPVQKILTPRYF